MRIAFHFVAVAIVSSVVVTCSSRAFSQVFDPSTSVGGVSQAEWSVRWWEWLLSFPYDRSPATDESSHLGDQGPVFFLGASGGEPTSFDVTIDSEDYVFLPLLGVWTWADDPSIETEASLRADSADAVATIESLFLEIDGVNAPGDLFDLRQQSPPGLHDLNMPEDNFYGMPAGVYVSVFEGYYAMLEPLTLGEHTIQFGGTVNDGQEFSTHANVTVVPIPGDFDADGYLGVADIDRLTSEVAAETHDTDFDLNSDQMVDGEDLRIWVKDLKTTWFGDANLDGEFSTTDLTSVFEAGKYEDDIPGNSVWSTGDWNGDAEFDSGDLVIAFQDGGYEQGPLASVSVVPEPASLVMLMVGLIGIVIRRRRSVGRPGHACVLIRK